MSANDKNSSMRAVILVGGFGTRLRPLTLTAPKPLVPFCNKPMIVHQVEALKEAGVTEIILAVAYRPEAMKAEMDEWARKLGVTFVFSVEEVPLGTAGPLGLARDILLKDDNPFFVLNSDVTCTFPLKDFLAFHRKHGKEGSIMVTKVEEWEKYGVVVYDDDAMIKAFVEKPKKFVGDRINAGIYILNKSVLERIPPKKTSIEREIFPVMANDKQLCAFNLEGFWMDIGQPRDFVDGMDKFITSLKGTGREGEAIFANSNKSSEASHYTVLGGVIVHPTAKIGKDCVIGPSVTIGANCVVGAACRISNSAIFDNTTIGMGSRIHKSIVGWNNRIGRWCHITDNSVFGDDVDMNDGLYAKELKVLPNKGVSKDYFEGAIIM